MRLDHLLSKETRLREILRQCRSDIGCSKYCSVLREPFLSTKFHVTWNDLFFENCIEEGNERKIFHKKCFSDVPKEISKRLNRKVKKAKKVKV